MTGDPDETHSPPPGGAAPDRTTGDRTPGLRREEVDVTDSPYHPVWSTFALLLHGPVLWAIHFLAVYLAAEWACTRGSGVESATAVTLWTSAVVALLILGGTVVTVRRWRAGVVNAARFPDDGTRTVDVDPATRDRQVLAIGLMLSPLFLLAVLAVGATAVLVPAC